MRRRLRLSVAVRPIRVQNISPPTGGEKNHELFARRSEHQRNTKNLSGNPRRRGTVWTASTAPQYLPSQTARLRGHSRAHAQLGASSSRHLPHDPRTPSPKNSKKRLRRTFRAGRFPHTQRPGARPEPSPWFRNVAPGTPGAPQDIFLPTVPQKHSDPKKRLRAYVSRYTLRSGMSRGAAAAKSPLLLMSLLAFPSSVPSSQARHSRHGNTPKEALIPLFEALLFSDALRLTRDGSSYG